MEEHKLRPVGNDPLVWKGHEHLDEVEERCKNIVPSAFFYPYSDDVPGAPDDLYRLCWAGTDDEPFGGVGSLMEWTGHALDSMRIEFADSPTSR